MFVLHLCVACLELVCTMCGCNFNLIYVVLEFIYELFLYKSKHFFKCITGCGCVVELMLSNA